MCPMYALRPCKITDSLLGLVKKYMVLNKDGTFTLRTGTTCKNPAIKVFELLHPSVPPPTPSLPIPTLSLIK